MRHVSTRVICLPLTVALACGALSACDSTANADAVKYADVTDVKPVTETVKTPREVCEDVEVTHREEPRDRHEIAGTAIGAVVGGALGNQVGKGNGRKAATVAGAVAGGYAGKRIQESRQQPQVSVSTERRCHTEIDTGTKVVGYDVTYAYNGTTGHVRMDHKPGDKLPVRQGVMVVDE